MNNEQIVTYMIKSFGCKVSQYDGQLLAEKLESFGLQAVGDKPDLYILNGCSVTSRASQKVRQAMRSAARRWPGVKIVLTGCEARLRIQKNQETPEADWVMPYFYHNEDVLEMINTIFPNFDAMPHEGHHVEVLNNRTRAFLKVQDGCNQFCAYCIVAYLRGEEWSRSIENAVEEAKELVKHGYREIVLTGIHLGHFKPSLLQLLQELEKVEGLERIRLSSIEPIEVDDGLINWVKESPKACHHFHLPLQSGCDEILKSMRRPYNTNDFAAVVDEIRRQTPLAAITTDLIVGFPGETDEHFAQTLDFLKKMKFSRLHIFRFSPRDGTPAATMPNQVSNAIKSERSHQVEKVWHESALHFHQNFVGKEIEILWETRDDDFFHGLSREYVPCFARADQNIELNTITRAVGKEASVSSLLVDLTRF